MNPEKIPFTDAYVKEQSSLSLGTRILASFAAIGVIPIVFALRGFEDTGLIASCITVALILLVWAGLARQRVNTFRENLELYKMIQQLRKDKDVAGRQ